MLDRDIMEPEWIRLKKFDGHLGALYHPEQGIIRFISRDGTVDYDLASYREETQKGPYGQTTQNS